MKFLIIDYGMGNLRSVQKAFERLQVEISIGTTKEEILASDKLILPGVGHFAKAIDNLKYRDLFSTLNDEVILNKKPILGICLGMQLMTKYSEEGNYEGFGWVDAYTERFTFNNHKLKIPHMGWNNLMIAKNDTLLNGIVESDFFYFVHSYNIKCNNQRDVLAFTDYGKTFVSVFQRENVFGCQFHPEKSHSGGLKIIRNFIEI